MKELQKLESKCTYDSDNKKWKVPLFSVGQKQVSFPKLKLNHGLGLSTPGVEKKATVASQFKVRDQ